MQNIYAYNLITILNCAKIKALKPHLKETSFFYDVPFEELDPLKLEDVIKVAGLYPLPFFSLRTTHKKCYLEESLNIKHLWQSVHLANHIHQTHHTLTVASTLQGAHLYTDFCLTNKHWELLKSKCRSAISIVYNSFRNSIKTINYPPPEVESPNQISVPLEKLLRLRLSDKVIAGLSNIPHYQIRYLREAFIKEGDFLQNSFVQKRALDRNSMNRFVLFLADCFFDFQIQLGLKPVHAFIKTVETLEYAPTYLANKSDDFHLSVNLYYWLCLQNKLPDYECRVTRPVEDSHFPDSFLAFYEFNSQTVLPPIREMGEFPIPHCLDLEHQRVLNAINNAIPSRASLRKVLTNYFGGQYK